MHSRTQEKKQKQQQKKDRSEKGKQKHAILLFYLFHSHDAAVYRLLTLPEKKKKKMCDACLIRAILRYLATGPVFDNWSYGHAVSFGFPCDDVASWSCCCLEFCKSRLDFMGTVGLCCVRLQTSERKEYPRLDNTEGVVGFWCTLCLK